MEHHFDVDIACQYGWLEAILLNHFAFWIRHNEANDKNYHDGTYWTFNTTKALRELFPYVSERSIQNAIKHLKDEGVIITGNYNDTAYDRTLWYSLTEKGKSITQNCEIHSAKLGNGLRKNVKPIPDIIPDTDTDRNPDIDMVADAPTDPKSRKKIPPTVEDVRAYVEANGLNVDADAFMDHYIACGWLVGKKPMKDWQAACRNWSRNSYGYTRSSTTKHGNDLADFLDKVIAGEA